MPGESYWFAVANQTFDVAGNVVSTRKDTCLVPTTQNDLYCVG